MGDYWEEVRKPRRASVVGASLGFLTYSSPSLETTTDVLAGAGSKRDASPMTNVLAGGGDETRHAAQFSHDDSTISTSAIVLANSADPSGAGPAETKGAKGASSDSAKFSSVITESERASGVRIRRRSSNSKRMLAAFDRTKSYNADSSLDRIHAFEIEYSHHKTGMRVAMCVDMHLVRVTHPRKALHACTHMPTPCASTQMPICTRTP